MLQFVRGCWLRRQVHSLLVRWAWAGGATVTLDKAPCVYSRKRGCAESSSSAQGAGGASVGSTFVLSMGAGAVGPSMSRRVSAQKDLYEVRKRVAQTCGHVDVASRYHMFPAVVEDHYEVEDHVLGHGYNGLVSRAVSKANGQYVAVKTFKLWGISERKQRHLRNEVEIFISMDHPQIARLYDVYEGEHHLDLVMECLEGGELLGRIREMKVFSEVEAAQTGWQMLLAINYLHSHGVIHRDIKCENFIYESKQSTHLKLLDFGFSRFYDKRAAVYEMACGSLNYMAPEVIQETYTDKCDLWSFGVVMFILLFGHYPFVGHKADKTAAIMRGKFGVKPHAWERISPDARDFIQKLLAVNPDKRLSAPDALKHPWMSQKIEIYRTESNMTRKTLVDSQVVDALKRFANTSKFRRACMSIMAWTLTSAEQERMRQAFIALDTDGRGVLTLFDLKTVLERQLDMPDDEVKRIFDALDQNHDEEIEYNEFLAAMMASRIAIHDGLVKDVFQRLDSDCSGSIEINDLRHVFGTSLKRPQAEKIIEEAAQTGSRCISFVDFQNYLVASEDRDALDLMNNFIDVELESRSGTYSPLSRTARSQSSLGLPAALHSDMSKLTVSTVKIPDATPTPSTSRPSIQRQCWEAHQEASMCQSPVPTRSPNFAEGRSRACAIL